jgi:site-specific DNA-adenine methylase
MDQRVISFPYPGGKYRIWQWLLRYFPTEGRRYFEPFAGRGNVFFNVKPVLHFTDWRLNDLNTGRFFKAIQDVDTDRLPFEVNPKAMQFWADRFDPVALVVEPVMSYRGKGFEAGGSGQSEGHSRYNRGQWIQKINLAKTRLTGVMCMWKSWEHCDWAGLTHDDFVYVDPPYVGTSGVGYDNIDHEKLIRTLISLPCRWVLSGYESDLYARLLGEPKDSQVRNREMTNEKNEKVMECIWTN